MSIAGIIIGIIAGFIGCKLTGAEGKGCIIDLLLGLAGGWFGGWLFAFLGISWGGILGEIATAAIGAALLIWLWNKIVK